MNTVREVNIVEVGPRDGFQSEAVFIPTEVKAAVVNCIAAAGVRKIESTSFVHPALIPQLSDARELMKRVDRRLGVSHMALVPNLKGAQNALDAGIDVVRVVIAATDTSNRKNVRMAVADSLRICEEIIVLAGHYSKPAEVVIGVAFGCPFEGEVSDATLDALLKSLTTVGFTEISLADTVGVANPAQVRRVVARVTTSFPKAHLGLHFHNTRGLAMANVLAALDLGMDTFDTSVGGLGGCPIITGGKGNVATEDLVNMTDEMGIPCGVSLPTILEATRMLEGFLKRPLPSYLSSAGTRQQLFERTRSARGTSKTSL